MQFVFALNLSATGSLKAMLYIVQTTAGFLHHSPWRCLTQSVGLKRTDSPSVQMLTSLVCLYNVFRSYHLESTVAVNGGND